MNRSVVNILSLLLAGLISACGNDSPDFHPSTGCRLHIVTSIDGAGTKAAVTGTNFTTGNTIGLMIARHGDDNLSAYNAGSGNIYGILTDVKDENGKVVDHKWTYKNEGSTLQYSDLLIFQNDESDNTTADVYAYAPWVAMTAADSYAYRTFDLGTQPDVMWASQNSEAAGSNFDISPLTGSNAVKTHTVAFNFKHKLAALVFKFEKSTIGNNANPTVSSIKIERLNEISLYKKVKLIVKEGSLEGLETAEALNISYNKGLDDKGLELWMLIYPADMSSLENDEDPVYDVTFNITGCEISQKFTILKKHLLSVSSEGSSCGFEAGKAYKFSFKVDNFVHFKGISIDEEWHDKPNTDIII